ncbi:MAG TPA: Gfo/Idh/MocA family oxidoreductase [Acetobacteraceae bacterium]|nr:Gfo/Idh/MocA family oxidoreductase [Acetobacteraceae bacterium]
MIRAAIVGLGWWGRNLVDSVRDSQQIRFTTAHTRTAETVAEYCRERGLHWIGDLDAVLRDPAIDAVVYATPHTQHTAQVMRAAQAGKAVFVEKPLALSTVDAYAAAEVARDAGVVLAVGYNRRFHPSMALLRRAVRDQRLGTLVTLSAEQTALHGLEYAQDAWRAQSEEAPGGAMTASGVHLVDGMIDLAGRVASVYARVTRRAAQHSDDTTDILLTFENGASGHIFCSVVAAPNYRMAVYGTEGLAEIIGHPMQTFRFVAATGGAPQVTETPGFNMLAAELEAFAASVESNQPFPTPIEQVLHGVEVFEAVVLSARIGETVRLL